MPLKRISRPSSTPKKLHKQTRSQKSETDDTVKKHQKGKTEQLLLQDDNNKKSKADPSTQSGDSKMTLCTVPTVSSRPTRRPGRPPSGKACSGSVRSKEMSAKVRSSYRRSLDPCDNSNDSGIGYDHNLDPHHHTVGVSERLAWSGERAEAKRPKLDIKLENEELNDGYCFPESGKTCKDNISLIRTAPTGTVPSLSISSNSNSTTGRTVPRCITTTNRQPPCGPVPLTTQLLSSSRYLDVSLVIIKQPEQQHRARYQTEGSRGAVKDREGNGFPVVQLNGYYKPATLQVFIGTDVGKVSPHMFYQACKVSGKNSTPCLEKKVDGTCVIELQLDPSKEMSATCDCVGILKERNVDVEHRFPDQLGNRSKKKSTRCRMIFRTMITLDNGTQETLQVCSQPIVCTQPPGIPEICKKSLTSCPASGGLELFVLGKNFLKDTKVFFQQYEDGHVRWEKGVVPDKEYLQQTHLVCVVPPFHRPDITEPVSVRLCVVSSGKTSESHHFVYTPVNGAMPSVLVDAPTTQSAPFFKANFWQSSVSVSKMEHDLDMMPPPESSMVPMATRRPSISVSSSNEVNSPPLHSLKQEYIDENSQGSLSDHERYRHLSESSLDANHGDSTMSMMNDNSMDMIHQNSIMSQINENSNISVGNEDSVDIMVRRNSMSRPSISEESVDISQRNSLSRQVSSICENSLDCGNSDISAINEDSSCSTKRHADRSLLPQLISNDHSSTAIEVIDLRMKLPMGTVADLGNATVPSMAALQRFGIVENSTLPAQSAQSVENYLTKIEAKPSLIPLNNPTGLLMKNDLSQKLSQIITTEQNIFQAQNSIMQSNSQNMPFISVSAAMPGREPVYLSSARPFMSATTQNEAVSIVAKSESADVAERTIPEQTNTMASSTITTIARSLERSVPTPINTDRLDALVNSTVESHLSPTRPEASPKDVLHPPEVMLSSQDVMLNSQNNLMVPPIINTRMPSPVLGQQEITNPHNSPNLTSEVILNSQISPSLMCRNTNGLQPEALMPTSNLNICQSSAAVEPTLLPNAQQTLLVPQHNAQPSPESIGPLHSPISVTLTTESEKAVLFKAAVDLFETQKKISEFAAALPSKNNKCDIISITSPTNDTLSQLQNGNNFVQSQFTTNSTVSMCKEQKSDFVMPIPVKDIASVAVQNDKKNEDQMIPQSFTSLTENELINFINPSCFDQV